MAENASISSNKTESVTLIDKLNKYRNLKLIQAGFGFLAAILFFVSIFYVDIVEHMEILLLIPVCLILTIICMIAALFLHIGNNKARAGFLYAFFVFACLSYGPCDKGRGGFPVVMERIEEIKHAADGVEKEKDAEAGVEKEKDAEAAVEKEKDAEAAVEKGKDAEAAVEKEKDAEVFVEK